MLNTELRKKAANDFEKDFYKIMCNAVFGKIMQNVRSEKNIKLVTTDNQRNKLISQPNFYSSKWFSNNLLAIEMKKVKVKMNKPIYLGMSIPDISKIPIYGFWFNCLKPKYKENLLLCCMDTDSYISGVKTKDWYKDIPNDIEKRFDTSNIQINIPIKKGGNKKVLCIWKDELSGFSMKEFLGLRPKPYAYLIDNDEIGKRAKGVKKCVTKKNLKFNNYKDCLMNNEKIMKCQQTFKSERHLVSTIQLKKIALSNNDDKRLSHFDRITTHAYGTNIGRICKN